MKETNLNTINECIEKLNKQPNGVLSMVKGNKIYHLIQNNTYNEMASAAKDTIQIKQTIGEKQYMELIRACNTNPKDKTKYKVRLTPVKD